MKKWKTTVALLAIYFISVSVLISFTACESTSTDANNSPKYVFFIIGDGFGVSHMTATSFYLGQKEHRGEIRSEKLNFMEFPSVGLIATYDAGSFITDSASAGTALASGVKTYTSWVGVDRNRNPVPSIADLLYEQHQYRIGIIADVQLNHATPASFFANQDDRFATYGIAYESVTSGFHFLGGGGFEHYAGREGDEDNIFEIAGELGFAHINTSDALNALTQSADGNERVIATNPRLDSSQGLYHVIDRDSTCFSIANFTSMAINVLTENNDDGFFLMVEAGKIDHTAHENDAKATIYETIAMIEAIDVALDFYAQHPNDTLIVVTSDHETGGFSIGNNALNSTAPLGADGIYFETNIHVLDYQQISARALNAMIRSDFVGNEDVTFEEGLQLIQTYFGLTVDVPPAGIDPIMQLTARELNALEAAFDLTVSGTSFLEFTEEQQAIYSMLLTPFATETVRILNTKAGFGWTSSMHTGEHVPIFAKGIGSNIFTGVYDNTEVFFKFAEILNVRLD
ncbi:MAG: alkaline phosphatase [Oscillospiraceae bacterium]|nr:alkaline phosphatase [Oscillospiraceae bacterium]